MENLKKLNHLLGETEAVYHQFAVKIGVSNSVNRILYALYMADYCSSIADICLQTGLSKQTLNSSLRILEKDNIVIISAINGKAKQVSLTDKGKQFVEQNTARLVGAELYVLSQWSSQEIEQYLQLTERFLQGIRQEIDKM